MAKQDAIEFECPHCQQLVRYVAGQPGSHIRCANCRQLLDISRLPKGSGLSDAGTGQAMAFPVSDDADEFLPALEDLQRKPDDPPALPAAPRQARPAVTAGESPFPEISQTTDSIPLDDYLPESLEGVYGVTCHVCDTRIHVRPEQMGQTVECPICYTAVVVTAPRKKSRHWSRGGASAPGFETLRKSTAVPGEDPEDLKLVQPSPEESDPDELQLADPISRPTITQDFGLPYHSEDLLMPQQDRPLDSAAAEDGPAISPRPTAPSPGSGPKPPVEAALASSATSVDSGSQRSPAAAANPGAKSGPSRRERLAEAELRRQQQEANQGFRPRIETRIQRDFPEFSQGPLVAALKGMVSSPGLAWRVGLCAGLMLVGVSITEFVFPYAMDTEGLSFWEYATAGLVSLLGFFPYYLGLMGLWLICGFLFRDAASGLRQVENWNPAGSSELTGTFLLFAFSFFIAGLPATFFPILMIPLRVLLGPLFLLAAWFNRSAFQIVTVDIFSNARKLAGQWQAFYLAMATLAAFGLLAGFLFMVRGWTGIYAVDLLLSLVGTMLNVVITVVFAILTGWHCGRVIDDLEQS